MTCGEAISINGWHFATSTLRGGTPLPAAGAKLLTIPNPKPCFQGYHANRRAIDALNYAPGPYVAHVQLFGIIIPHGNPPDKYAASNRVGITNYVDSTECLRKWSRECALDIAHLWDAPDVVHKYLETGDESLRAAAWTAARNAAWTAAKDAAWAAVWAAAEDAAWVAAWAAARAVVRTAVARDATRDAQNTKLESMLLKLLDANEH